jgi:DNA-binding Xre family transcriptional regulator
MNTLEKLCKILDCQAEGIVTFLDDGADGRIDI